MNGKTNFVTIKVTPEARRMLRVLAADSGSKQWQELEILLRTASEIRGLIRQPERNYLKGKQR